MPNVTSFKNVELLLLAVLIILPLSRESLCKLISFAKMQISPMQPLPPDTANLISQLAPIFMRHFNLGAKMSFLNANDLLQRVELLAARLDFDLQRPTAELAELVEFQRELIESESAAESSPSFRLIPPAN